MRPISALLPDASLRRAHTQRDVIQRRYEIKRSVAKSRNPYDNRELRVAHARAFARMGFRTPLVQREVHRHRRLHLDRLLVEDVRTIAPLAHGRER